MEAIPGRDTRGPAPRLLGPLRLLPGLPDRDPLCILARADGGRRGGCSRGGCRAAPNKASRRCDPDRSRRSGLRIADDLRRGVDHVARSAGPLLHAPATAGPVRGSLGRSTAGLLRDDNHGARPGASAPPAVRRLSRNQGQSRFLPPFRPPCWAGCRLESAATSSRSKPTIIIFASMRPEGAR